MAKQVQTIGFGRSEQKRTDASYLTDFIPVGPQFDKSILGYASGLIPIANELLTEPYDIIEVLIEKKLKSAVVPFFKLGKLKVLCAIKIFIHFLAIEKIGGNTFNVAYPNCCIWMPSNAFHTHPFFFYIKRIIKYITANS
jgi:hypothetical protein